jgi:redox-sensitive bicupin YhaK (pirin superfamily)
MKRVERLTGRTSNLGDGLTVRRALPTRQRRMVGAWCFLDHLGPLHFAPGQGMHVGAHPHTALQTFTWLIEGEVLHRDSLGNAQIIRPGQVNLMTAGRGVVHSEDSLHAGQPLHAAQLWIALPPEQADCAPAFAHYPDLPRWIAGGCAYTLLAGQFAGRTMAGDFRSPLLGVDLRSAAGGRLRLPLNGHYEHGILVLAGDIRIGDEIFAADEFAYLGPGFGQLVVDLGPGSHLLLLGGEPFAEPVLMWWNFVGYSRAAIAEAQRQWETGSLRFGRVDGDSGRRLVAPPLPWPGY